MASPEIAERLGQFWLFEGFSSEELARVASFTQEQVFPARHVLFRQGDPPDHFYLVDSGVLQEIGEEPPGTVVLRRRARAGDFVGHRSLMGDTAHQATATVVQDASLLVIQGHDFRTLLAMFPVLPERLRRIKVVNRLLAIPLFACFSESQLFQIADLARDVQYPAGQTIFSQGEPADAFYVINTGQVRESVTGTPPGRQTWPKYLSAGDFFGRHALLSNTARRGTAMAVSDAALYRFSEDAFQWLRKLQPGFDQALRRPDILSYLSDTRVFAELDEDELKHLAGYAGLAHYRAGDTIYRQGDTDPTFYILYQGEAIIRARDERGVERPRDYLKDGNAVGETSLFLEEPRDVTVVSTTPTNWFYVTRQDLEQFLTHRPRARDKLVIGEEVKAKQKLKRFEWMDPDERVIVERRRHWIAVVNKLTLPLFVLLAILAAWLLFPPGGWRDVLSAIDLILLILASLWIAWRVVDWYNDYYVVTTKRVSHREKVLAVRETRDEAPLGKVQNVNIARGFLGNLVGFGKLVIDTAAASGVTRVTFDYLAEPEVVQALIFEQMSRVRAGERLEARRAIQDRLEASLGTSIRPLVPRPAVPSATVVLEGMEKRPTMKRIVDATLWRLFWIEDRTDDQVTWRKHWIHLLRRVWKPVLVAVAMIAAYLVLAPDKGTWLIGLIAFLLPLLGWCWWGWEDWRNDLYIVTNDRIVDTERLPLGFRSKRTETTFDKIQNVSYDIPHPIATLFNYGTVFVFTAGAEGRLDFQWVRDPRSVQAEIFRRLAGYEEAQRHHQRAERWEDLSTWFSAFQERRPG